MKKRHKQEKALPKDNAVILLKDTQSKEEVFTEPRRHQIAETDFSTYPAYLYH